MSAFFNCNEAILLIETRAERARTLVQRLSLWFHLLMCVLCRRYARQTEVVAQLARRLGRGDASAEKLSAAARAQLELLVRNSGCGGKAAQ